MHVKTPEVAVPSNQVKKHIFFAYADDEEPDVLVVEKLKNSFIQRRFRVYQSRKNDDINVKIAHGFENAAVILAFPSSSFQLSKTGSKLLYYADQTKNPILTIQIDENFRPKGWLGAILAPSPRSGKRWSNGITSRGGISVELIAMLVKSFRRNSR